MDNGGLNGIIIKKIKKKRNRKKKFVVASDTMLKKINFTFLTGHMVNLRCVFILGTD